jgi:hypothetical protein
MRHRRRRNRCEAGRGASTRIWPARQESEHIYRTEWPIPCHFTAQLLAATSAPPPPRVGDGEGVAFPATSVRRVQRGR